MSENEDSKSIDRSDLEIDFSKLTNKHTNRFPIEVFPKILQDIILEANAKYKFSQDYLGTGMLAASSSSIGNSHKVLVKQNWIEKANLFIVIVGKTGDSKTHALNFSFKPIHIKEDLLYDEYEAELKVFDEQSESEDSSKKQKPILKKYLISDFTPEALILNHSNNPRGLYIYVDELKGWIKNFNRYNNSGEEEIYLSLWSGTTISSDRASGKSTRIKDPFIGVIGSAQISVLNSFAKDGRSNNGFMDRLLFVYPDDLAPIKWNIDQVDKRILENYFNLISNIVELSAETEVSRIINFSSQAKAHLFEWQNNRPEKFLFEYERSIEVKLQQYVIRFSLLLQIIQDVSSNKAINQVSIDSVKGAIQLFEYFRNNAIKVREEITKKDYVESLTELQKSILAELPDFFKTSEGIEIACKKINNKPRISVRQFKTYLKDKKLFKRVSHGHYEKILNP